MEWEVFHMAILVASSFGGTQWVIRRLQGGNPQPWNMLLRISSTPITTTIVPTKSGPSVCPVSRVDILSLQPKRKFSATQADSPMMRCQRALKRSAMKPLRSLDTP